MTELTADIGFQVNSAMLQAENFMQQQKTTFTLGQIKESTEQEIEKVAQDFEAVFLTEMIKPMFEGLETNGIFGGGHAEKVYRSLMVKEYGDLITKAGGMGIAEVVKKEMMEMQSNINAANISTVQQGHGENIVSQVNAQTGTQKYNEAHNLVSGANKDEQEK